MRRRHMAFYQKYKSYQQKKKNRMKSQDFDYKLKEMKETFNNMLMQNQMKNDYRRLNDKLSNLENIISANYNYNNNNDIQGNNQFGSYYDDGNYNNSGMRGMNNTIYY